MKLTTRTKRALLPLYQKTVRRVHDLNYLFLELTHDCNLNCLHCGSDCIKDSKVPHLPEESVLKVLGEIRTKYNPHNISVVLSGGEPLCYPSVFQLGKKITELEFPWGMVTNGFGWTPQRINDAQTAGLQSITVSLDGLAETHDWLRGRKRSFNRAVETISMLVAHPFWQAMDVITCVNKRNIDQLDAIYALLKKLGVTHWRLFIISPIGRALGVPDLFLDQQQFLGLTQKIKELKNKNDLVVNLSESGYLGPHHELTCREHYYFCRAGINIAGIMVNGDILACPNIDRRFKEGNIGQDSFVEVWENRYQKFRNRAWMKTGPCRDCGEWKFCQGNSFHLWDIDQGCPKLCHCKEFGLLET